MFFFRKEGWAIVNGIDKLCLHYNNLLLKFCDLILILLRFLVCLEGDWRRSSESKVGLNGMYISACMSAWCQWRRGWLWSVAQARNSWGGGRKIPSEQSKNKVIINRLIYVRHSQRRIAGINTFSKIYYWNVGMRYEDLFIFACQDILGTIGRRNPSSAHPGRWRPTLRLRRWTIETAVLRALKLSPRNYDENCRSVLSSHEQEW